MSHRAEMSDCVKPVVESVGTAVTRSMPAPTPLLSPGVNQFLEGYTFGRWGIRAGRKIVRILRKMLDPVQHKVWIRKFGLPLRNAMLLNRPLTISFDGNPVRLLPRGATAGDIWAGLSCEKHEVAFLLGVLEPGMIFFDVGANAGLFTISAARKIGGKGVFAFEPCSPTYGLLKQNLLLNQVADVHMVQTALGDSSGHEDARMTTVDIFMKERNIPRVDVMRGDVEGAELLLFRGARNLLERTDAPLILYNGFASLTRGFGYHPVEIIWLLESCGYTFLGINRDTGAIFELKPDYQYDSMIIAAKPCHAAVLDRLARFE